MERSLQSRRCPLGWKVLFFARATTPRGFFDFFEFGEAPMPPYQDSTAKKAEKATAISGAELPKGRGTILCRCLSRIDEDKARVLGVSSCLPAPVIQALANTSATLRTLPTGTLAMSANGEWHLRCHERVHRVG
eukprot:CAMPEP_0197396170 /NCGR_PEP_ID=MMETSP1165-20131217/9018_1 /TAXON_ID=284809 /ORGANISM="Chrysocystis fragilis, Strain CCMP3189" /LENGTH=133 /DNA_ID=CAMNT_0042921987 /DNA_START=61 /DNA_END=460 /DNA_ORIENTATION=+